MPEFTPFESASFIAAEPFYGYKKARIDFVTVVKDMTGLSDEEVLHVMHRAKRSPYLDSHNPEAEVIIKLTIPRGALCVFTSNGRNRKYRCDIAKVTYFYHCRKDIYRVEQEATQFIAEQHLCVCDNRGICTAFTDPPAGEKIIYEIGKGVRPIKPFDDNPDHLCGSGIHFFMTYKEADEYELLTKNDYYQKIIDMGREQWAKNVLYNPMDRKEE